MRFKHSVSITHDQFTNVFKLFLYQVVVALVSYSLIYIILQHGLAVIVKSTEFSELSTIASKFIRELARSVVRDNPEILTNYQSDFHTALMNVVTLIGLNIGSVIGSVIGVVIMYFLQRYVNGIAQFAIGGLISDRMNSHAKTRFAVSYFRSVGKAALYYLFYIPISLVYDLLSLVACWYLFFYVPTQLGHWYIMLSVIVAIALTVGAMIATQAFKLSLTYSWMPAMIADGKTLRGALKDSGKAIRHDFWRRLGGYVVACYLIVAVNVVFGAATGGSGILITVPLSYVFLIAMQFVNYYGFTGKKYFLDKDVVWQGKEEETELIVPAPAEATEVPAEETVDPLSNLEDEEATSTEEIIEK